MIETFEGRLGGGKTYSAVERAMDVWRRGGTVFANVEFNWDACVAFAERRWGLRLHRDQWVNLDEEQILEFHKFTAPGTAELPSLTIIDEAHIYLGVLEHGRQSIKPLFIFLTQSRKQNSDIIFITQNARNIDSRIARLVQFIWRFRDLEKWNIPGLGNFSSLVRMLSLGLRDGRMLLQVCFDYDGKTVNEKRWRQKDKAIFALYNTNALLSPIPRLERSTTHQLEKVTKKGKFMPWMRYAIPVLLLVVGFSVYRIVQFVRGVGGEPTTVTAKTASPSGSPRPANVSTAGKPAEYDLESEEWLSHGRGWMRLKSGFYQVGTLSKRGYVEGVQDFTVKVRQPNGRILYIVGQEAGPRAPVVASSSPPAASATPKAALVIPLPTQENLSMSSSWKR